MILLIQLIIQLIYLLLAYGWPIILFIIIMMNMDSVTVGEWEEAEGTPKSSVRFFL